MIKSIFIFLLFSSFFGAILWNLKALGSFIMKNWKLIFTVYLAVCATLIITLV